LLINSIIPDKLKIFFSGIAGSGLSALACFMADKGNSVYGSDRLFDISPEHPLKRFFSSRGIHVVPQDGHALDGSFSLVVFSTAVEVSNPELIKAVEIGLKTQRRPDFLFDISSSFNTIAVTGTSGKSTTSGLLAFIMKESGLAPNLIGGGRVKQFITSVDPGNYLTGDSDILIIEACESDGSIVNYMPDHTIILNLELDHHPVEKTAGWFETLIDNTSGKVILNADDDNLMKIADRNSITFSINSDSDYRAEHIDYKPLSTGFSLNNIKFNISLPGRHNLYNAISSIALLAETGVDLDRIADIMPRFLGIERRFDVYLDKGDYLVIDDYAHNPHKISFLMETVKKLRGSICYIFQPHGFGPTRLMKDEYISVFSNNLRDTDHLVILPIYYSGGTASMDISSNDLASGISSGGKSVEVIESRDEIKERLNDYKSFVIFGARDDTLADLAREIADILKDV
jgi:UDP-N-acetylmuramate--alanine ligase